MIPPLPGVKIRGQWKQNRGKGGQEDGDVPIVIRGDDPEVLKEDVTIISESIPNNELYNYYN